MAFLPTSAHAQLATGGAGVYRNQIVWLSWGAHNTSIPQTGLTVINSTPVAGQFLRTTCTLSGIGGNRADPDLIAYRPGSWTGDIFDDMYFTGAGAGASNTLVVGLGNRTSGSSGGTTTASGFISCSATFGPTNSAADPAYAIGGLVFADAEQSSNTQGENVSAQGAAGTTWRLLERASTCGEFGSTTTHTPASFLLSLNGANNSACTGAGAAGPAGIAFLDGATSMNFAMVGGGRSALALGVMVHTADLGDAPATYGQALHLPRYQFSGGVPPTGNAGLFSYSTAVLSFAPVVRLGNLVDTELVDQNNATASGDDVAVANTFTFDDEDSIAPPASIPLAPGSTYTLNNVQCGGVATVYGYVDFNRDGDFADSGERSGAASCPGTGPVALTWTLPAAANLSAGASFLRLRIGTIDTQVNVPTGNAFDGEVEDYPITLQAVATVTVTKVSNGGVDTFAFSGTNGFAAQSITTTTPGTGVAAPIQTLTATSTATTITETAPPVGFALQSITCTGLGAGGTATPTINGTAGGSILLNAAATVAGSNIQCTFTNARQQGDLSITKTNTPGVNGEVDQAGDTVVSGGTTTYALRVTNNGPNPVAGAVVRDTPGSGITCPSGNAVTITGNGVPAGTFTVANLAAGIALDTLTTGQTAVLTFTCNVQQANVPDEVAPGTGAVPARRHGFTSRPPTDRGR